MILWFRDGNDSWLIDSWKNDRCFLCRFLARTEVEIEFSFLNAFLVQSGTGLDVQNIKPTDDVTGNIDTSRAKIFAITQ